MKGWKKYFFRVSGHKYSLVFGVFGLGSGVLRVPVIPKVCKLETLFLIKMKEIENVMRHWIRFQSWFYFPMITVHLPLRGTCVVCMYFGCIYHCISCTRKRQAKQSPQRLQLPSHWFSQDSVIRLLHLIDLLSTIQGSKSSYF